MTQYRNLHFMIMILVFVAFFIINFLCVAIFVLFLFDWSPFTNRMASVFMGSATEMNVWLKCLQLACYSCSSPFSHSDIIFDADKKRDFAGTRFCCCCCRCCRCSTNSMAKPLFYQNVARLSYAVIIFHSQIFWNV